MKKTPTTPIAAPTPKAGSTTPIDKKATDFTKSMQSVDDKSKTLQPTGDTKSRGSMKTIKSMDPNGGDEENKGDGANENEDVPEKDDKDDLDLDEIEEKEEKEDKEDKEGQEDDPDKEDKDEKGDQEEKVDDEDEKDGENKEDEEFKINSIKSLLPEVLEEGSKEELERAETPGFDNQDVVEMSGGGETPKS